jgi:CBS domain-containing protein
MQDEFGRPGPPVPWTAPGTASPPPRRPGGVTGPGLAAPDSAAATKTAPGFREPVGAAVAALEQADAAVVVVDGKPAGIVTRQDLLNFLATRVR